MSSQSNEQEPTYYYPTYEDPTTSPNGISNLHSPTRDATTSTIAMAMLFGTVIFTTASLAARLVLMGLWNWRDLGPLSYGKEADPSLYSSAKSTASKTGVTSSSQQMQRHHTNSNTKSQSSNSTSSRSQSPHKSQPLNTSSLTSIYSLLHHATIFALILFYSYICEHHPPYPHEEKAYDRDEFFFWTVLVVVFAGGQSIISNERLGRKKKKLAMMNSEYGNAGSSSANGADGNESRIGAGNVSVTGSIISQARSTNNPRPSVKDEDQSYETGFTHPQNSPIAPPPKPDNEVLNRYQTEEWKGWMQFVFLLYHYMHATEIYNGIRVMITCYVWMTGFGNFSFFYLTNDYSLPRVLQMLWRLNFLVFFLCLTHGNPYILYYICPLHTYFFLMVYAVMSIGKEKNYTKWWIRIKLGVLAFIIFFVWDCNSGIFERMHQLFLGYEPVVGASMGTMWEWYFRSYLDHWSTLLGMVFALNFPIISLFYRKLEARSWRRQWLGKSAMAVGLLYALYVWVKGPLQYPKISYNGTNPYFGFIPLITYIYLRNLTPTMRSYSLELLHEIGKTTLETYLMQHHIWLSSNSKSVLVFLPGWPRVNMALVTYFYVVISRKLHKLTLSLRGMLLPDDRSMCIRFLSCLGIAVAGFYAVALVMDGINMMNFGAIGVVSIVCGSLLYQTVMDSTWANYRKAVKFATEETLDVKSCRSDDYSESSSGSANDIEYESIVSKVCPPIVGTMVLLVLGLIWSGFASDGAASIGPLPPGCDAFVNDGKWIQVDGCNESSRGMAYRTYGVASYGTCMPHGSSYIWSWIEQPSHTHCRFSHRGESRLKKSFNRRKVVFVGDSMTRNLYHSTVRAMGKDSGAYDATLPKHADISNTLWGTTPVTFKWSPLAVDQLSSLKEINRIAANGDAYGNLAPDLIVLGGGAWDRLHVYATDEDRQSHTATLKDLGSEMVKAQKQGSSVVWFIPTTINSQALNTEEKRDHMREEDMEAMRAVYARNGILASSSFVIDGPAFTASRVSESYDGVHYPPHVYDAGAQILFNAVDWLLPGGGIVDPAAPPRVGKMANPMLGIMVLIFVAIGLVCFDGFLGFSYLASLFVKGVMPHDLYEESYTALHKRIGLKGADVDTTPPQSNASARRTAKNRPGNVDEEIAALLGTKRLDIELSSHPSM